jgi:8-oxo-dGTP pyrophosphatase MutT (NUDIX family)
MSGWTIDQLRDRLGARELAAAPTERPAAVAVVLRLGERPSVLLMKRAERDGDPWSGQVSLPGGRFEAGDRDLLATAIRETREELGIDLATHAHVIGGLDPVEATGRSTRPLPATSVTPYVFVEASQLAPVPGPEATSVFWLPIETAARGGYDGEMEYLHLGQPLTFPCWRFEGYVIWGLTYRMLGALIEAVAVPTAVR